MSKECVDSVCDGDIFTFAFNAETIERMKRWTHDPYWCFDAQLVARTDRNGDIVLVDTYWGWPDKDGFWHDNKQFSLDRAQQEGTVTFVANEADLEPGVEADRYYYAEGDIVNCSYQHGCYKKYMRRRGAQRDHAVMLASIDYQIEKLQREIEWKQSSIVALEKGRVRVLQGDRDVVYIV